MNVGFSQQQCPHLSRLAYRLLSLRRSPLWHPLPNQPPYRVLCLRQFQRPSLRQFRHQNRPRLLRGDPLVSLREGQVDNLQGNQLGSLAGSRLLNRPSSPSAAQPVNLPSSPALGPPHYPPTPRVDPLVNPQACRLRAQHPSRRLDPASIRLCSPPPTLRASLPQSRPSTPRRKPSTFYRD